MPTESRKEVGGAGVCLIDPLGSTAEVLLDHIPSGAPEAMPPVSMPPSVGCCLPARAANAQSGVAAASNQNVVSAVPAAPAQGRPDRRE